MPSPEEIAASALAEMDDGPLNNKNKEPASTESAEAPQDSKGGDPCNEKPRRRRGPKPKIRFLVEPVSIQIVPRRKEYVNHSYRDFSTVPAEPDWELPTCLEQMTFSEKVHDILTKSEEYGKYMSWQPHGRAFHIHVPALFEKHVCPKYFGHKRYSSFLRQLNNHSFKHISKGMDRNCYYHECILRGLPHLCRYMPEAKDARRQIPDPDNEPDFSAISEKYPLPLSNEVEPGSNASVGPEMTPSRDLGSGANDVSNANPSTLSVARNGKTSGGKDGKSKTRRTLTITASAPPSNNVPPFPVATSNPLLAAAAAAVNPPSATANNPLFAAATGNPMAVAAALNTVNRQFLNPFVNSSAFPDNESVAASLGSASAARSRATNYSNLQELSNMNALAQIGHLQKLLAQKQPMPANMEVYDTALQQQQQQQIPAPVPPQASVPAGVGLDRRTSNSESRRLQGQIAQLPAAPPQKTVMDRNSALAEIERLQQQLASRSSASSGAVVTSPPASPRPALQQKRRGMDRDEALAEISQLRAHLTSELTGQRSIEEQLAPPPAKRQATTVVAGNALPAVAQNLSRISEPFSQSRDLEAFLQRDAIVAAIRRQQQGNEESLGQQQRQILEFQQLQRHQQDHQQRQLQAMQELETLRNVLGQQQQGRHSGYDVNRSLTHQRQHGQEQAGEFNRGAVGNPSTSSSISEFLRYNARFS